MADNARGIHVSPGIYTREYELNYAVRSLGITTLGVVGETVKGPAFQPIDISNWREFQDIFGGTNTEKFKGSQYPKYELPYIAKSYLSESEQLKVVRVLGLSGYNAGPAWLVTASNGSGSTKQVVAVIRSRGTYNEIGNNVLPTSADCVCQSSKYDTLKFYVGETISGDTGIHGVVEEYGEGCYKPQYNLSALQIAEYLPIDSIGDECNGYTFTSGSSSFDVSATNRGRFRLIGIKGVHDYGDKPSGFTNSEDYFEYAVSLNPLDKDYILNVLGTRADDGNAPIYVESLYDVALQQAIDANEVSEISNKLVGVQAYYKADFCHHDPVDGLVRISHTSLRKKDVGKRFLPDVTSVEMGILCTPYDPVTDQPILAKYTGEDGKEYYKPALAQINPGQIQTVRQWTSPEGKRYYVYASYDSKRWSKTYIPRNQEIVSGEVHTVEDLIDSYAEKGMTLDPTNLFGNLFSIGNAQSPLPYYQKVNANPIWSTIVLNKADGIYYKGYKDEDDIRPVTLDMNDYKSSYRYASTPWIVSNLKGDKNRTEVNRLFRFHTISDGTNSNYEIKISIENIKPDEGVFDVIVRKIDDLDESIIPLEKFTRCTMIPTDANYIAYKIGSFDGVYESKSKYITVEVNETTAAKNSVPSGFMGYPQVVYSGNSMFINDYDRRIYDVVQAPIKYNRDFDETIKNRKQYFGLSSWVGVDIDNFTFKGREAYIDSPEFLSHGFHLDSRLDAEKGGISAVTVDGEDGYVFDSVSIDARTSVLSNAPIIDTEENMRGSIYEYVNLRKFTVYFYGGFDGWDVYRDERTNGDSFKMSQYKGYINSNGEGYSFNKIDNPDTLQLNQNGITSDWYAYLSAIRQFANPEATDINVLATPGIDYVNQKLLVDEVIEMVEEERADSIYVVTTPDKPKGAGDYVDEMYTPEDAVYNLEDTEIDSNYSCTYYPWVKYLDQDNNQYIFLPPTKDAVRNFAQTDNTAYPWFAPAGQSRGNVDCVRAKFITKISDEDVLYEGRINPIKTFAQDGPKIWGQKNLQINESQLNRIAVRRLLLRLRKLIAISCIGLIFEQYDSTVKQTFISTVTPILDSIRNNRGISDYRVEVDDSLEARQNRELPAKIYIKPYNALEYISIDFIVTPEGVTFSDI